MDLLNFSKFKLQLEVLIREVRELRENEQRAKAEHELSVQKHNQICAEQDRNLLKAREELAACHEARHKLEIQVKYLQTSNIMLEKKQQELKETIDSLIHSRETFIKRYKESNCELKRCIEAKDRKINILSQKLQAHLKLFECIKKDAYGVKQVVEKVECHVHEQEQVAGDLRNKMDNISVYDKEFREKINLLENRLRATEAEIRAKCTVISALKEELMQAKLGSNLKPQVEELQRALAVKEETIQNVIEDRKRMQLEMQNLEFMIQKIQDHFTNVTAEVQGLEAPECSMVVSKEGVDSLKNGSQRGVGSFQTDRLDVTLGGRDSSLYLDCHLEKASQEKCPFELSAEEANLACSPSESCCVDMQSEAQHAIKISTNRCKRSVVHQLDSESSTVGGKH